jgi:hypothetical protein
MSPYDKMLTLLSVSNKDFAHMQVYIVSWTLTFKVSLCMSHNNQSARAVRIYHRVVPSLVLSNVGVMHQVHRAFKAFEDPDQDLTRFFEQRILPRCDQFLVPWSHGIEPWLA